MIHNQSLLKGFEVELFTGSKSCEHIGVANEVIKEFKDFVVEPDQRNVEYITAPERDYDLLKKGLLLPRKKLRTWLKPRDLTILPGSTISLGNSTPFQRSDYSNPYHQFIEEKYGTKVVTTSVHINLGVEDLSLLFSSLRLLRCEAAVFLALSASSPFLDGVSTGFHSQRWKQFPLTPLKVPIFLDHSHYVQWIEEQLSNGIMTNERHLWTSVRPNGPQRPYELNRLEMRICDLISDCDLLLAITALLELRVISMGTHVHNYDPLLVSSLSVDELAELSDMNDSKAAKYSLDATLRHWTNGKEISCRDWVYQLLEQVRPLASEFNMVHLLRPIELVLDNGNQAMKWLNKYSKGLSIQEILNQSILAMEDEENNFSQEEVIF